MQKHFDCSNCGAPLVDIKIDQVSSDIVWPIQVHCCHCGDHSYTQEINGVFSLMNDENTQQYTVVEDINTDNSPIVFKTAKVNDYVT